MPERPGRGASPRPDDHPAAPPEAAARRLARAQNLWLATVRPNGTPHLVPIWFVWHDESFYVCTSPSSVKARNIARSDRVTVALEDGTNPLICQGRASAVRRPWPDGVVDAFRRKYEWSIRSDVDYSQLIRIQPTRWIAW